jgi:uncharacterized protein (DUF488 family)
MTDMQLYITAGLPTIAALVGILMNVSSFNSLSARLLASKTRWTRSSILSPVSSSHSLTAFLASKTV